MIFLFTASAGRLRFMCGAPFFVGGFIATAPFFRVRIIVSRQILLVDKSVDKKHLKVST